jgi:predicted CXXCH cytochrome family protein
MCHGDAAPAAAGYKVQHSPFAAGECSVCHSPHSAKEEHLLVGGVSEVCASCHATENLYPDPVLAHTPVREGRCDACHAAHGSDQPSLLKAAGGKPCLTCHEDIGKLVEQGNAHEPVSSGTCESCHDAHGTMNPSMLKSPALALCAGCHDTKDPALAARHHGFDVGTANCLSCHDPHSDVQTAMASGSVHGPYKEGACDDCHQGATPKLRETQSAVCFGCHSNIEQDIHEGTAHGALEGDRPCTACHSPHAATGRALLVSEDESLCATCHPEEQKAVAASEYTHPSQGKGSCLVCHEPHTRTSSAAASPAGDEACLRCHDFSKHVTHPMGQEALDPRTKEPTTCLSCHSPHGSGFKHFLAGDPSGRLCVQCHTEKIRQQGR